MRVSRTVLLAGLVSLGFSIAGEEELPNRVPEAAPYDVAEARSYPPPYDEYFARTAGPAVCAACHRQIFDEWNGSMMSNAWRDPIWRAAFLLVARLVSTDGHCAVPAPPDGSRPARLNPFANDDCSSTFDLGAGATYTTRRSGSLLDGFCSRCHMPANYIDAVKLDGVRQDGPFGLERGAVDKDFDPTSSRGTPFAFATLAGESRNSDAGKIGITCTFCHTNTETRQTPFHNYTGQRLDYGVGRKGAPADSPERFVSPSSTAVNLGYDIGGGAFRISPKAIVLSERFGPLTDVDRTAEIDRYVSSVFNMDLRFQQGRFEGAPHRGRYHVLFERAEFCGQCHDVTNPLTITNELGRWVGGFPIERTYSEWAVSRYADRPGNRNFDPAFKRDCQTCHMQQDYGQAGTAQTLYAEHGAALPRTGKPALTGPERPIAFSHHFVGGNTYSTRLIGADVDAAGQVHAYPELSVYSYSSADESSPYHDAYWLNVSATGPQTQHARMAWDRLRHAVSVTVDAPATARTGTKAKLRVQVRNTGTGHKFPTGFPEGRNAWVAVRAIDVGTGGELEIEDSFWKRRSRGVGFLTAEEGIDPNFPGCDWHVPAGAPDPYAWQFRAVATRGDGCPTLDLPYATPLNLLVDGNRMPVDENGEVIGRENPLRLPVFEDRDGDGDLYDDAFLIDRRLRPLPHAGATVSLDRYSVVIPWDAIGPVAVTVAVYYQSLEAMVAKKFGGNLADTDMDGVIEPCVLRGPCDGRVPRVEPAVVEGAPPVPIRVASVVIDLPGQDEVPPHCSVYPAPGEPAAYRDTVVKITASEPILPLTATSFTLTDENGSAVAGDVQQIADFTWAFFPDRIFLEHGKSFTARVSRLCDIAGNCAARPIEWKFSVAPSDAAARGDTSAPVRPAEPRSTRNVTSGEPRRLYARLDAKKTNRAVGGKQ